ncbi:hypothetical protein BDFB_012857 [Asbolus verrucosus]|uniref:Uncharacterized protein n=1 Tax=Asbolus verrucosus TaxID=1661398 RepID=A0A482VTY5_ASBVE|nr:hypothetical protein BDFB_012857 [Asbolus verrucosus]
MHWGRLGVSVNTNMQGISVKIDNSQHSPNSLDELRHRIQEPWNEILQPEIDILIYNMLSRGDATHY